MALLLLVTRLNSFHSYLPLSQDINVHHKRVFLLLVILDSTQPQTGSSGSATMTPSGDRDMFSR